MTVQTSFKIHMIDPRRRQKSYCGFQYHMIGLKAVSQVEEVTCRRCLQLHSDHESKTESGS